MRRFKVYFKFFVLILFLGSLGLGFYPKTIYSKEYPEHWLSISERINSVEKIRFETVQAKIDKELHWEDEMISVVLEKIEKRHDWPTEIFSVFRYKLPENHVFIVFHLSVSFKKQCEGKVSPGTILHDNDGHECRRKFELSKHISGTKWSVTTIHQIHIEAKPTDMVLKYTWKSEKNGDKKNGELQLNLLKKVS